MLATTMMTTTTMSTTQTTMTCLFCKCELMAFSLNYSLKLIIKRCNAGGREGGECQGGGVEIEKLKKIAYKQGGAER